ncbi:MAG: Verru_Chthon cassette protein B [Verrucomicrobiota bacterium]
MHRTHSPQGVRLLADADRRQSKRGFSLIEITLSLGIIAFAFVALFGLLPVGLTVFRNSVDIANETWIMQDLNTMVQVTEWPQVRELGHDKSGEIYYFDEEGRMTDSELRPSSIEAVKAKRLYAVKLIIDDFSRPGTAVDSGSVDVLNNTWRILAIFAPSGNPQAMKEFTKVTTPADVVNLKKGSPVKVRSFVVARMDSQKSKS